MTSVILASVVTEIFGTWYAEGEKREWQRNVKRAGDKDRAVMQFQLTAS